MTIKDDFNDTDRQTDGDFQPGGFDIDPKDLDAMSQAPMTDEIAENTFSACRDEDVLPEKKGLSKKVIIGAAVGLTLAVLFFGFAAYKVLGGKGGAPVQRSAAGMPPASGFGQGGQLSSQYEQDALALEAALNGQPIPASQSANAMGSGISVPDAMGSGISVPDALGSRTPSVSDGAAAKKNLLITFGAESLADSQPELASAVSQGLSESSVPPLGSGITAEEQIYDDLLTSIAGIEVPPEAIKIDSGIINRTLETQRLETLESDIRETRTSIKSVSEVVNSLKDQVTSLSQVVETSAANQAAATADITKLTEELAKVSATQDKEIKALRNQVSAAVAEVKKAASARPAPAPVAAPAAPQLAAAPAPTPMQPAARPVAQPAGTASNSRVPEVSRQLAPEAQPRTVLVQASSEAVSSHAPSQCVGATTVLSAVWRVKGVNASSAYVVRSQDQEGLYVKSGVDVPGFGQVVSFDPSSRSVCTTQGLIRR